MLYQRVHCRSYCFTSKIPIQKKFFVSLAMLAPAAAGPGHAGMVMHHD
jgi:hypothetical protein